MRAVFRPTPRRAKSRLFPFAKSAVRTTAHCDMAYNLVPTRMRDETELLPARADRSWAFALNRSGFRTIDICVSTRETPQSSANTNSIFGGFRSVAHATAICKANRLKTNKNESSYSWLNDSRAKLSSFRPTHSDSSYYNRPLVSPHTVNHFPLLK